VKEFDRRDTNEGRASEGCGVKEVKEGEGKT
jgi:hypothetical protein